MASGEYADAIPTFEKVDGYESRLVPGALGRQEQLSVCHWLVGNHSRALDIIRELVASVRDGKITYTDFAGGVSQGMILCYMAVTLRSPSDVDLAMSYLKNRAEHRQIHNWPGPAALYLLGQVTFDDAVQNATGFTDLTQAKAAAEQDLMKRRHLTNILFSAAVERRMAGEEAGCHVYMAECASLTTPLIEYEWHLAKGESSNRE